jgi:hypothetical protein
MPILGLDYAAGFVQTSSCFLAANMRQSKAVRSVREDVKDILSEERTVSERAKQKAMAETKNAGLIRYA